MKFDHRSTDAVCCMNRDRHPVIRNPTLQGALKIQIIPVGRIINSGVLMGHFDKSPDARESLVQKHIAV